MSLSYFAQRRISMALLLVGPVTTLAISPSTSLDPISLIKLISIGAFGFGVCALTLIFNIEKVRLLSSLFRYGILIFVLSLFSTFLFSGSPLNQQFWGVFGRNNGMLCYLSLIFILASTAIIEDRNFYKKLINALILTSIPMTIYCLMQMNNLDPIKWSEFDTFGTLGNINFLSAFFGLTTVALVSELSKKRKLQPWVRLSFLAFAMLKLYIIYTTGSIQGLMMFFAGTCVLGMLFLRSRAVSKRFEYLYFFLVIFAVAISILGLSNRGPLARFLFQPSVIFRADYMHAGIEMTLRNPIFGVGLDSYGDYYREYRGYISTVRTGPDRVANTAHNIFLDISSNGGLPLLIGYLMIIAFVVMKSFRIFRDRSKFESSYTTIFVVWVAYQIQALISINQIGVGVWGWLLTGALAGFPLKEDKTNLNEQDLIKSKKISKTSTHKSVPLPIRVSLVWWLGLGMGALIAFIPFQADANFKKASNSRILENMFASATKLGASGWHLNLTLDAALKSNAGPEAKTIATELVRRYPRDFFGWRVLSALVASPAQERRTAFEVARKLDPFNIEIQTP